MRPKMGVFTKKENLNFIWVGKPRSQLGEPLGTDLEHVVQMAKKANNPVSFYCLEEHEQEYKKILKENNVKNVSVVSIDKHIDKMANTKSSFSEQGKQMQSMRDELLNPPRNRIIDKVTFKDAFSLFILATKGGYTLDTNIQLDSTDKKFTFPKQADFHYPWSMGVPEVWMMYAPQKSQDAQDALTHYLKKWGGVQDIIRNNLKNPPAVYDYHRQITGLMTDSVDNGKYDDTDWKYAISDGGYKATIPALPIAKNYGNSHKPYIEVQEIIRQDLDDFINERNDGPSSTAKTLQGLITKIDTMIADKESPDAIEIAQLTVNHILKFTEILDEMENNFSKHKNLDKSISSDFTDNLKTARKEMKDYAKQLLDTPIPQMPEFEDGHKKKFDKLINGLKDLDIKANKSQAEQKISNFKDFKSEFKQSITKPPSEKNIQNDASDDLSSRNSI